MTYQIYPRREPPELRDEDGNLVEELDSSFSVPEDIVDAILEDMGVGKPQRDAFSKLFKQDWEIIENE